MDTLLDVFIVSENVSWVVRRRSRTKRNSFTIRSGMKKFMIFVIFLMIWIQLNYARAQQNVLDQGLTVLAGVAAKGKEIIDHGVNLKAEKQQNLDFFGLKLGASNGVNTGFGDAAMEKSSTSEEDVLLRKKRSMDHLATLRSTGMVSSSATGLSVNVVTINSVSNVNNYGPTPETTTAAESRRRKRLDFVESRLNSPIHVVLDDTGFYSTKENELEPNDLFKSLSERETRETHRSKRSPQETNTDVPATTPASPSGGNGPRGDPDSEGGLGEEGGGRRGPPGRKGPGRGRGGKHRRPPPPPPPPSDEEDSDDTESRGKREAMHSTLTEEQSKHRSSSNEYQESVENASPELLTEQLRRDKREPCGRRRRKATTTAATPTTSTVAPTTTARRRKRELTPEQGAEQATSWFSAVLEVIVNSAKRLVQATRSVFTKDQKDGMGNNEEVETME
ncbi:histone-lysine N-methyltransferase SETD1A-like isoform X2 [Toxorhynchites rutilus septentrionalis]|uniref:histone-lysine N-methyltransferase SETD1A-like isoform X2 n=1 Tax=Toxorhynchites rutilus septentrionalis TaxID=329112 RepID=UPI00247A0F56|nr:histone-lysine N-methyltransferase SETD1A-like isoform X2 [Toxorhynchites rutilus septentrionalis]